MLWEKAEMSGFTSEELAALKEEFNHHQDKIDQYYDLLKDVESGKKDGYQSMKQLLYLIKLFFLVNS